jgi:hypothetical protein
VAANGDRIEDLPNWDPVRAVVVLGGDRDALSAPAPADQPNHVAPNARAGSNGTPDPNKHILDRA